ncbi:glyoxalase family protein [Halalkaliarchaeum desulfuricum]|uniref:Glyoxalase family protein n=1 Tax=Halalkaliarchaeum desulfuricum TaxID=2055893 RepID=A0A343TKD5_9EURY|nr:VOC family protein [Halalkaliarchaeum desulfuricum]AUX09557.1 glyoxalase family protein [Halalkaliarchaeum desulfuricum]
MTDVPPTTGLHHVTNICTDIEETKAFYEDVLGWQTVKMTENYDDPGVPHYYFSPTPTGEPGTIVSYFEYPDSRGAPGPGAGHHFAFGVEDEKTLEEWRTHLKEHGVRVSEVTDRTYFKSVYFSDPDGLVFELATAGPGFTVDEDPPGTRRIDPSEEGRLP